MVTSTEPASDLLEAESDRQWYSVAQLAEELEVPEATVRGWVKHRRGPAHYKLGKLIRFERDDVIEWKRRNRRESRERPQPIGEQLSLPIEES